MTAVSSHRLEGLEPDNLLAFLALLGLLKALDLTRPEWKPRAYWDLENAPLRPVLTTREVTTQDEISKAAIDGLLIFKRALQPFSWPRSKQGAAKKTALFFNKSRQRTLSKRCISALDACTPNSEKRLVWQLRCDLLACSGASHPNPKREGAVDPTPLKLPSGQMTFIGTQFDLIGHCIPESICACLFDTWAYAFKGNSLRFSPDEARRYAYRAADPSPEGSRTELGASALSGLGLLAFIMSDAQPRWKMVAYVGTRSEGIIGWPIWGADGGAGASFDTITAMLRSISPSPMLHYSSLTNLAHMLATARRYVLDPTQGDYGNIARAKFDFPTKNS